MTDAERRHKAAERSRARYARIKNDPAWRERLRAQGREASRRFRADPVHRSSRNEKRRAAQLERYHSDQAFRRRKLDSQKWGHIKRTYGLSRAEYSDLLRSQGGVCLLCGKPPRAKKLVVDHDHATGSVRALLHTACNVLLGVVGDTPDALRRAAERLERSRSQEVAA